MSRPNKLLAKFVAALLLFSNIYLPTGLHRVWLGVARFWLFPVFAIVAIMGMAISAAGYPWGSLLFGPFCTLFFVDLVAICAWSPPSAGGK